MRENTTAEVFVTFLKLGCTSFGGPIAHLGYFHKELVEKRGWVNESQYGQLLAICQFLPGPASSQLGFSLGLLRAGWTGALTAFIAFTLPSAILLIGFASLLPLLSTETGQAIIQGLKIVALVVVADAVLGMAKKLCPDIPRGSIAALSASFLIAVASTSFSATSQLLVVALGGIAGVLFCRELPNQTSETLLAPHNNRTGYVFLALFFGLLILLPLFANDAATLPSIAQSFYQAGALVFGGGHVVLPLLEESMVSTGWLSENEFLAGYGASQAIPGPLFAFSAYLGALTPSESFWLLTASTALVFIFLPGFLLVLGVLPLWRQISKYSHAQKGIAGINAAVVGLLAAALYDPIFTSAVNDPQDLAIAVMGFALLHIWKLSPLWIVCFCSLAKVLSLLL